MIENEIPKFSRREKPRFSSVPDQAIESVHILGLMYVERTSGRRRIDEIDRYLSLPSPPLFIRLEIDPNLLSLFPSLIQNVCH